MLLRHIFCCYMSFLNALLERGCGLLILPTLIQKYIFVSIKEKPKMRLIMSSSLNVIHKNIAILYLDIILIYFGIQLRIGPGASSPVVR